MCNTVKAKKKHSYTSDLSTQLAYLSHNIGFTVRCIFSIHACVTEVGVQAYYVL